MKNQIFQMSDYVVGLLAIARYCDFHLIYVSLYLYFLLLNSLGIAVKDWKKYVYIYNFSFFFLHRYLLKYSHTAFPIHIHIYQYIS